MVEAAEGGTTSLREERGRTKDKTMAITVIGGHTLEHLYAFVFPLLVTAMYADLGLIPIQAGILSAVRQLTGGLTSIGSGFFVDLFPHRSGQVLAFSMVLMGVGHLLVAISPTYSMILAALFVASIGVALWHPPALGLLAQRFPRQKGLYISLHRSTGSAGDLIGPLVAGVLLGFVGWRWIMGGVTPLALLLAVAVLVLLWNVTLPNLVPVALVSKLKAQFVGLKQAFRGTGMWTIFTVSATRGMGDRSYVFFLPLYLREELDKSFLIVALHVALIAAPGIVAGPWFGALSDRIGRRAIIAFLMIVSVVLSLTTVLGGGGIGMTASVALFGLFHSSVNSLTQAAAIDEVEGRGLDATFMGIMWGGNFIFGAGSALVVGWMVQSYGWETAFYCASGLFFLGFLASLVMPASQAMHLRTAQE